ncbi:sensor histidine kinase [Pseudoduganella namucuonensis]|uniref:histidine kinase n=1 Tax=Pseudoduganella namucuonensis TaxID=1035707 RepID=A0A1I7JMI0_9BURK|nr:ATP-binding protein [Pseudoduganella namucuonensis]SFU86394.1 Signal transduction histidine kinase [Pseudoduganella namucuonensis]
MPRLYFRFYAALLASLATLTIAVALLWHYAGAPFERSDQTLGTLLRNALPAAEASPAEQQAALEHLTKGLRADITLYSREWERLAFVGEPLPRPERMERRMERIERMEGMDDPAERAERRERMERMRRHAEHADLDERPAAAGAGAPSPGGRRFHMRLEDGRHIVSSTPLRQLPSRVRLHTMLIALAIIIALGAYPVVRRLTRRLEHLQQGVESLGAGNLGARVEVKGGDEVARLAAAFNRSADQIEALVGAHKSMLANASHELRTPLARIRLAMELSMDDVDPKRRKGLEQDIAELDQLIDEILLASRLDSAHTETSEEQLDLLALAAEECARYEESELEGESAVVRGDPRLLRRLLRNLLENARRHGAAPTSMYIRVDGGRAEIRVQDAGPGVPKAEQDKVFEPFYRSSAARDSTGSGLGLALVRQIARRHGGEARCVAEHGGRSAFIVTLPLAG